MKMNVNINDPDLFKLENVNGISGRFEGNCPVQGYGQVDGHAWYFRARGNGLTLYISPKKDLALVEEEPFRWPFDSEVWVISVPYGTDYEAGYIPYDEAKDFVLIALNNLRISDSWVKNEH